MKRTTAREIAFHLIYASGMNRSEEDAFLDAFFDPDYYRTLAEEDEIYTDYPDEVQMAYIRRLAGGAAAHSAELDSYIERYAKNWQFARISRLAAAMMRTAMFEILYMPEVPYKAAANEAVELAKTYEGKDTAGFINGILATFIQEELKP